MGSVRQLKFAKLIQKELSEIFQKETRNLFGNIFITITHVDASPDLSFVKVYLSFLLAENKEDTLIAVQEKAKDIRKLLGAKIRKDVRIIPEIAFFGDDSAEYAINMENILSQLNSPSPKDSNIK